VPGGESGISAERDAHGPGAEAAGTGFTADVAPLPEPALTADYRLTAGSPLIDAADPASGDESATDAVGAPRALDGNGDCAAVPDVGAFELVPAAVTVRAGAPAQASAGQAIAFSAAGTCDPDPSAPLTYAWAFDDGTTATGPTVEHAFATGGTHTGTLTVTGGGGRTGSASASVAVIAATVADRRAPRLGKLRRVKRTLRFTLDEPATVAVRIQRCTARNGACKPAQRAVKATWTGKAGANRKALPKRVRRAGRYRVRLVATDRAGNRAKAKAIVIRLR
jgi:hypothetical protein